MYEFRLFVERLNDSVDLGRIQGQGRKRKASR